MIRALPILIVGMMVGFVVASPGPRAQAAPPPDEQALVRQVNAAIQKGVQFLRVNMRDGKDWEGFWEYNVVGMEGGVTALATLALLNCGEKPETVEVAAALKTLRALPLRSTYVVALVTMALAEARQPRDLPLIQANVDWLLKTAVRSGGRITGWTYSAPEGGGFVGPPDGSNTQYALLGLYAGKQAGARISEADWEQLFELYLKSQKSQPDKTGSWSYQFAAHQPSFTMTVAGVSGLVISGLGLDRSRQNLDPATGIAAQCGLYPDAEARTRGLNYIGKNFTFIRPQGGQSTFYNIYGIERVGRLSGQRFLGTIDWYREGCEFLVKEQRSNGAWTQSRDQSDESYDGVSVIGTSFALLFLSKGRTPILMSKLAWGEVATDGRGAYEECGPNPRIVEWNRKQNDVRHLTEFASRELFKGQPMGWQVYDPRRRELKTAEDILSEVGVLVQSPILYLNGHSVPRLTGQQKELIKKYVEEGGFIVAEACCGSPEFTAGFRRLVAELFPTNTLKPVPAEHPLWQAHFAVSPSEFPKLEYLDRGCRTVLLLSPEPLAGFWEEAKYMPSAGQANVSRGGLAYRLGANMIAYATGLEPPKQRLSLRKIANPDATDRSPPNGFLKPAQIRLTEEPAPAPSALRNLMGHARTALKLDVVLEPELITTDNPELFKYKLMYLHGRKRFTFNQTERENLQVALQTGAVLLADAACGNAAFDEAFRSEMRAAFPDNPLTPIPPDDELYSQELNGISIQTVKRREKPGVSGAADGFIVAPPLLEGIKIEDRWVVVYSKYDLGCSLEGNRSTDCLGHTRESALDLATAVILYMLKK